MIELSSTRIATSMIRSALPIGAFYLTEILIGLTDLAVVGRLGTAPLAAVGLAKTVLLSVMMIGFALLSVGLVLMAERDDPAHRGRIVAGSLPLILPFGVVALLAGAGGGDLLTGAGYDPAVVAAFDAYAPILAWAGPPTLVFAVMKNVLTATDRTGPILWLSVGMVLANFGASVVLVHGIGGWEGLGVAGAAWATLAVNVGAACALTLVVVRADLIRLAGLRPRPVLRAARDVLSLGWAAGAQQVLESGLFTVVLFLVGLWSALWLAAVTVVFAVMELTFAVAVPLGEVLSARLAAARAAGKGGLLGLYRTGAGLVVAGASVLGAVVWVFAEQVATLFAGPSATPEARDLIATLLRWTAPVFLFDAIQLLSLHALRGLRRVVGPMILSSACYWLIGLGGGLALAYPGGLGAAGIYAGLCTGLAAAAVLLGTMAWRGALRPVAVSKSD